MEAKQSINRLGLFTASQIYLLYPNGKRTAEQAKLNLPAPDFSVQGYSYIMDKLAEIVTGECKPQVSSASLSWGVSNEKDASMWLQATHPHEYMGKENFKFFPYNEYSGGSPDGLSDTHVIELKCPYNASNHIKWLLYGSPKWLKTEHPDYYAQVQFNMLCCKRDKAIIASYDPRTIEHTHRMAAIEVYRDDVYIEEMCRKLNLAIDIVKTHYTKLFKN